MRQFDPKEIEAFDGKDGKPVYIVHKGKVYDVTGSKMWRGGLHMKRHHAGMDLTTDIGGAPHGPEVFERYPQVGVIRERGELIEERGPELLGRFLARYPMFRRHPHPMTVHFPIVFMLSTTFFTLLYLVTGVKSFDTTAFHCLGAGVLFMPVVMLTGLFSWWLNYMARPLEPVNVKIALSLVMLIAGIIAFTWRAAKPDILDSFSPASFLYSLLVLSFAVLVSIIGWHGAKMTFPVEQE